MATRIPRVTAVLFGDSAPISAMEQFGSFNVNGSPTFTNDPAVIPALPAFQGGWSIAQYEGQFAPYLEDRNGVDRYKFAQIAEILQDGIPPWDAGTTYFKNSVCVYNGIAWISISDGSINNRPPLAGTANAYWTPLLRIGQAPTWVVHTSGSGTYTPPFGCVRIRVRLVGGGGGGGVYNGGWYNGTAGGDTTLGSLTARGGGYGYPGTGGAAAAIGSGGVTFAVSGSNGSNSTSNQNTDGGASVFGGAGKATSSGLGPGPASATGYGSGGSGVYGGTGAGGGAGAYLEATVSNPSAMSYSVGAGGSGGSSASTFYAGNGAGGCIIIEEQYL